MANACILEGKDSIRAGCFFVQRNGRLDPPPIGHPTSARSRAVSPRQTGPTFQNSEGIFIQNIGPRACSFPLSYSLSWVTSLSLSPALARIGGFWPHRTIDGGGPTIESAGDRTQVSVSSSALASFRWTSPRRFLPSFLHFLPPLFFEVNHTEHLKSGSGGGVLESQILGKHFL